jgi:nicotinamide mononucleotide transporter
MFPGAFLIGLRPERAKQNNKKELTMALSPVEAAGFATGGASVWLAVKASVWTWPVGIASNAAFLVLFVEARLFADSALQLVYVVLSLGGIAYWLRGGSGRTRAPIRTVGAREAAAVAAVTAAGTYAATLYLRSVGDAAPFLDATTTCLSLAATYLQVKKLLESWYVWIAADLVYVPLYVAKDLPLTAVLYALFLALCVRGLVTWRAA